MDVSVLRIDPVDIYGQPVDYSKFRSINVNYSYQPTVQDETYVIGYPWIGSDTISETKGIVSGTSDYNGYKYIKTDTLIASGNSGGAMTDKNGDLIGIPTFTKGGESDSSLGYALSIADAKDFITQAVAKKPEIRMDVGGLDFAGYQKTVDTINTQHRIDDDVFSFQFGNDYEVSNYIPNRYFQLGNRKYKEIALDDLRLETVTTPTLATEDQFLYFAQFLGLYNRDEYRLEKSTIGGVTFYRPIYRDDISGGDAGFDQTYFARLSDRTMVTISLSASLYDERDNAKLKAEIVHVLSGFSFHADHIQTVKPFSLVLPQVSIDTTDSTASNDRLGSFYKFLGDLHEYISIQATEKDIYSGKGETVDQLYQTDLQDVSSDYKSLITLHGYRGYISCVDNSTDE